jgi:hypothetical protein
LVSRQAYLKFFDKVDVEGVELRLARLDRPLLRLHLRAWTDKCTHARVVQAHIPADVQLGTKGESEHESRVRLVHVHVWESHAHLSG